MREQHALPELNLRQLSSFIILPVQRVCKYPLLLKELIKRTPEGHGDEIGLKRAQAVSDLFLYIY